MAAWRSRIETWAIQDDGDERGLCAQVSRRLRKDRFSVETFTSASACIGQVAEDPGRPRIVLVPVSSTSQDRPACSLLRQVSDAACIIALADSVAPEDISMLLHARVDELILGVPGDEAVKRLRLLAKSPPAGREAEIVSAVGHWIEVCIPARAADLRWLLSLLSALDDPHLRLERGSLLGALEEVAAPAIEHELRQAAGATLRIASYRFEHVMILRIQSSHGVQLGGGPNGPTLSSKPGVRRHFITSRDGDEAMLVRYEEGAE